MENREIKFHSKLELTSIQERGIYTFPSLVLRPLGFKIHNEQNTQYLQWVWGQNKYELTAW